MIRGTEFGFLLKKDLKNLNPADTALIETELDRFYYASLWKALYALAPRDRFRAEKLLAEEVSLRNALWALRLRTYYDMPAEEVRGRLMDGGGEQFRRRGRISPVTADAVSSLGFALDNRRDWEGWSREKFLNPAPENGAWKADPRHFQNAASDHLYRLARRSFHSNPFSLDAVFCFIKLKQFEEDILTSVAEGLGLGMSGSGVFSLLEVRR
jgi:vacuolar-type H+-ATPase subunit C/Vma6